MRLILILLPLQFLLSACAFHHCRRVPEQRIVEMRESLEVPGADQKQVEEALLLNPNKRIFVYKVDGSLQCYSEPGTSLAEMAEELKGIEVFSQVKKPDGMMRPQVCGMPTGMSNVYEIAAKDLAEAEKRGFRLWEFD